ncbi:MAG TPA: PAS-domain containing protein [Patescibacteria group bacterium]|nr:PAS-domain containing protein [Patescibacteria group bacterium]
MPAGTAEARFWPISVRSRLLLAFAVIFASAMALALVGWIGIRDTRDALRDFQSHVLPDVARALELSQRTAAIAAMAPYVAESTRPFQLQSEAQALLARLAEAERLALALPEERNRELDPGPALVALKASIEELIEVTRKDLFLQEDLREYLYRLMGAPSELQPKAGREAIDAIFRDLMTAIEVTDPDMLALLRQRVTEKTAQVDRNNLASSRIVNLIRDNLDGPENVFVLRARQFQLRDRKAFLVSRTRAEAERLSGRVNDYVRNAREQVDLRGESVTRAVRSGALGIAILTLVCIAVAALGIGVVVRMVSSLRGITRVMSKLAQGDTEQSTPETGRRDELGALARAFEVFRDNARAVRRMANDIREQGDLLATVVESMKDGLSVFDRSGHLITWNRQYPALLNLKRETITHGMTLEEIQNLLPPQVNDSAGSPSVLAEFNHARQEQAYRFELAFADGRVVEFRSNPMPGGGFVTLYSDLTERRAVEMQLLHSKKMEVLGQLTGGVAHDFNNLLAAITGNLYLLEQDASLSTASQRFAARASSAARRGATLTRRLLAFARRQPLSPSVVEVDPFIHDLADLIEYSVGQGVAVELELNAGDTCAWVDRGQLENALLNLAINARDAMPDGGILSLRSSYDSENDLIVIEVADNGQGMTQEVSERVFEPFFTTKAGSGSGLGLSIVYGFVKQSGGDVQLTTEPGKGTSFVLHLPTHAREYKPEAAGEQSSPEAGDGIAGQSVLLVEDDPDVRSALADLLRATGHVVTVAKTAEEALELLEHTYQSVVLSDVDLGSDTHGVELMRRIEQRYPFLPRILMSGLPAEILAARFGLTEDQLLLSKPFTIPQLDAAIRQAMSLFRR